MAVIGIIMYIFTILKFFIFYILYISKEGGCYVTVIDIYIYRLGM